MSICHENIKKNPVLVHIYSNPNSKCCLISFLFLSLSFSSVCCLKVYSCRLGNNCSIPGRIVTKVTAFRQDHILVFSYTKNIAIKE